MDWVRLSILLQSVVVGGGGGGGGLFGGEVIGGWSSCAGILLCLGLGVEWRAMMSHHVEARSLVRSLFVSRNNNLENGRFNGFLNPDKGGRGECAAAHIRRASTARRTVGPARRPHEGQLRPARRRLAPVFFLRCDYPFRVMWGLFDPFFWHRSSIHKKSCPFSFTGPSYGHTNKYILTLIERHMIWDEMNGERGPCGSRPLGSRTLSKGAKGHGQNRSTRLVATGRGSYDHKFNVAWSGLLPAARHARHNRFHPPTD